MGAEEGNLSRGQHLQLSQSAAMEARVRALTPPRLSAGLSPEPSLLSHLLSAHVS